MGQTEGMAEAKAPLCKGSPAEGGEGLLQDKVESYMGTNANSYNFLSLCPRPSPVSNRKKGGLCSGRFLLLQIRISLHEDRKLLLRQSLSQLR